MPSRVLEANRGIVVCILTLTASNFLTRISQVNHGTCKNVQGQRLHRLQNEKYQYLVRTLESLRTEEFCASGTCEEDEVFVLVGGFRTGQIAVGLFEELVETCSESIRGQSIKTVLGSVPYYLR